MKRMGVERLQNKRLNDEVDLITQSSFPFRCDVNCGNTSNEPRLLHSSSKAFNQKHRRVIQLEFILLNSKTGLEWGERIDIEA
jgi:hypothetical protein